MRSNACGIGRFDDNKTIMDGSGMMVRLRRLRASEGGGRGQHMRDGRV